MKKYKIVFTDRRRGGNTDYNFTTKKSAQNRYEELSKNMKSAKEKYYRIELIEYTVLDVEQG